MKRYGDELSTEIWIAICEELVRLGDSYSSYRLLSTRCDEILTPYVFQRCELTANLISPKKDKALYQVGKQVQTYCTVLDCGTKSLEWEKVTTFIEGCNKLDTIIWHCPASSLSDWIPAPISALLRSNEALRLQYKGAFLASAVTRVTNPRYHLAPAWHKFPIKSITSFTSYDTVMCSDMQRLSEFLADAPHLTELSLDLSVSTQLSQSRFLSNRKLTALSSLHIMGNWYYTKEEVSQYWDFSKLTHLNLIDNPQYQRRSASDNGVTQQFLKSVPMDQLERITSLEVAHVNYYGFGFIQRLMMQHITRLGRLRLRSSSPMDFKHALLHHTESISTLTLEVLPGMAARLDSEHILAIRELAKLSNLVNLSLDLDFVTEEQWMIPENQLSTVSWLLHRKQHRKIKPEFQIACDKFVQRMVRDKVGRRFQQITLHGKQRVAHQHSQARIALKYRWNALGERDFDLVYSKSS